MSDISASEAVFGFAAWLTCLEHPVILGAKHDAAIAAELAELWCQTNTLSPPRDGVYPQNITQPKSD